MSGRSIDCYFDNVIFEKINKTYVDGDGNEIADPENPEYPLGGQSSDTPAANDHDGTFDFDSAPLGVPSVGGLSTVPNSKEFGNDIEIVNDPLAEDANDKALMMSVKSGNNWNFVYFTGSKVAPSNANCYLYEMDLYFEKAVHENAMQIFYKNAASQTTLTLTIYYRVNESGDQSLSFYPSIGSGDVTVYFDGEFRLRLEYYPTEGVIKIYNGNDLCGSLTGVPTTTPADVMFATLSKSTMVIYIDNVVVGGTKKTYSAN